MFHPGLEEREKLFKYYLGKVKHDSAIDSRRLARKAVGKSPAEIENIVKESALIATRRSKDVVSFRDISDAVERIELGVKHKFKMMPREKEMTAYELLLSESQERKECREHNESKETKGSVKKRD